MGPSTRFRGVVSFLGSATIRSIVVVWTLVAVLFCLELAFAFLLQQFVSGIGAMPAAGSISGPGAPRALARTTLLIAVVGLARIIVISTQALVDGRALERFCHRLRVEVLRRALASPAVDSGQTLTLFHHRILNASLALRSFHGVVSLGLIAVGLAAALFVMNGALTTALLLISVLAWIPMRVVHRRLRRTAIAQADTFSQLMTRLGNACRNLTLIRLHNLQDGEQRRFVQYLRDYTGDIDRYLTVESVMTAVGPLLVITGIVLIAAAQGTAFALERAIALPYLYLFVRLAQQLGMSAGAVGRLAYSAPDFLYVLDWWRGDRQPAALQAFRPAGPVVQAFRPADSGNAAPSLQPIETAIGWSLRNVTFAYAKQSPLFSDFSAEIPGGSLVHIAGPSGSGKTSLMALITGEISEASGTVAVTFNRTASRVVDVCAQIRNHIGYAGAEPYLFAGTLYQNVAYGLVHPPGEDALAAAAAVAECGFINDLPDGFAYEIDESGGGLSAGQRQRLSLLRALLRNPRALILDEALANLDHETEARILFSVAALRPGCTIVWVSHRPPAIAPDVTLALGAEVEVAG
jgi:ATP-binding cassette subfamily B multidrug efflux pump